MGALAVLLFHRALRQDHLRCALALEAGIVAGVAFQLALVDMDDHVDHFVEEIAIMRDDQQRAGVAFEPVFKPDDRIQIQMVGRFIEQQQVGRAHQRLRQIQPHAPAAGKTGDRLLHLFQREAQAEQQLFAARVDGIGVGVGQRAVQVADRNAVFGGGGLRFQRCQVCFQAAQGDVAVDRVIQCCAVQRRRFLCDIGDAPFGRVIDFALVGVQFAAQQAEQTGFAGAIGADQADLVAGIEGNVDIFEEGLDAAHQADLLEPNHN